MSRAFKKLKEKFIALLLVFVTLFTSPSVDVDKDNTNIDPDIEKASHAIVILEE